MLGTFIPDEFQRRFIAVALLTIVDENGMVTREALKRLGADWPDRYRRGQTKGGPTAGEHVYDFIRRDNPLGLGIKARRVSDYRDQVYELDPAARRVVRPDDWSFVEEFVRCVPSYEISTLLEADRRNIEVKKAFDEGLFDPARIRERRARMVALRPEQARFRAEISRIYKRCPVTGCDCKDALEASHVLPENGPLTNKWWNGMLLRADNHRLWDALLVAVEPDTGRVLLSETLAGSVYEAELAGRLVDEVVRSGSGPHPWVLGAHRKAANL